MLSGSLFRIQVFLIFCQQVHIQSLHVNNLKTNSNVVFLTSKAMQVLPLWQRHIQHLNGWFSSPSFMKEFHSRPFLLVSLGLYPYCPGNKRLNQKMGIIFKLTLPLGVLFYTALSYGFDFRYQAGSQRSGKEQNGGIPFHVGFGRIDWACSGLALNHLRSLI